MAGWKVKTLAEVCMFKPPKAEARAKLDNTEEVSFVPMESLGIGTKTLTLSGTRRLGEVAGSYTYFADGDVLLAKITPCFENGKLGIARDLVNGVGFGSSEYIVLRPGSELDAEFLYYYLDRPAFREAGAQRMTGAVGHKRIPKEFVEQTEIPLPPLHEQRRIVAILDEAFEGIATAKASAEKNLQNARELFAHHREVVLTAQPGWGEATLAELCTIKHGYAFAGEFFSTKGEYVLLTPGSFYETGGYRERGEKTKFFVGPILEDFVLKEGDLLVAMTEQAAGLLGSPLLVPASNQFLHNQRLGLVVGRAGVPWSNEFFFHVFNLMHVRREIHASASGAKVRHTSPGKIGLIRVAYPVTVDQQLSVAAQLVDIYDECNRLAELYKRKLAALDELKKSLLHQAFSGQL